MVENYKKILTYRSHLMGIAILWVVFFHMKLSLTGTSISFVQKIGYGGVDIFFFLSGIGMYYSLKKSSVETFYQKRIRRIIPAYLPIVGIVFLLYNYWKGAVFSFATLLNWMKQLTGNIFMTGWINGIEGQFNWYVQAIMWFYLITPVLMYFVKKTCDSWKKWSAFLLVLALIQIPFLGQNTSMMTIRILLYVIGMSEAYFIEEKGNLPNITAWLYVAMAVGFCILFYVTYWQTDGLILYGMYWFPFVLIVPGLSMLLSQLMELMSKYRGIKQLAKGIAYLGEASFEIYLVHITLFDFVLKPIGVNGNVNWILAAVVAIAAGIFYKKLMTYVMKKLRIA